MLLEIAKPIALVLCMVSLCALFYAVFLVPAGDLEQRTWDSLTLLSLTTGICLTSGMLFRKSPQTGIGSTLPVQIFFWAVGLMLVLLFASWYLETHCIFYKNVYRLW